MPWKDYGRQYTEKRTRELGRQLQKVYKQASDEMYMKARSFEHAHAARVRKYREQLKNGEITQADYEAWMRGQVFQREQWKQKQEQMAESMVKADKIAAQMINDGQADVFAENANYIGWNLERGQGTDIGFGVYDSNAVRRLVRDDPKLLPQKKVSDKKAYEYYNRVMNNSITQGIVQGEELTDIIMRVALDTGEKALGSVRRNVQTAYVNAQNAGRIEGMMQAEELGLHVKKCWRCSFLKTTREAHAKLDGQMVEPDEYFDSELGPIFEPGDPDADPANVYNCHCWVDSVDVTEEDGGARAMRRGDDEIVMDYSYEEWKEWKNGA